MRTDSIDLSPGTLTKALALSVLVAGCGAAQNGQTTSTQQTPASDVFAREGNASDGNDELYARLAALEARVEELSTSCAHGQTSSEQLALLRELVLEAGGNDGGETVCTGLERMVAREQARVAELSLRYGERHPDMLAARARQAALEARRVEACAESTE